MKNPLKLLWNWILRKSRKKEIAKREKVYDDVIDILSEKLAEKAAKQKELIDEIKKHYLKKFNIHYGSKFIPNKFIDDFRVKSLIYKDYGSKMEELGVTLTDDLSFVCI